MQNVLLERMMKQDSKFEIMQNKISQMGNFLLHVQELLWRITQLLFQLIWSRGKRRKTRLRLRSKR